MKKHTKELLIVAGIIVSIVIVALVAFALNPQKGLYQGMVVVPDTKLMSDSSKSSTFSEPSDDSGDLVMSPSPGEPDSEEDPEEDPCEDPGGLVISPAPEGLEDPCDSSEDPVISPAPIAPDSRN